jgi:hypothetical protein
MTRTIERALRVTHGRISWSATPADIRDTEPASLVTADRRTVRVQLRLKINCSEPERPKAPESGAFIAVAGAVSDSTT